MTSVVEMQVPVESLRNEVERGFMYANSRANANTSKVLEIGAFSYALIELLLERGVITVEELDDRKRLIGERLLEKFSQKGMGVAITNEETDKYACAGTVTIDCENRRRLCRSACCRLRFALTLQDVEEGRVKWELGQPYMIRQGEDGFCHHIERDSGRCGVYHSRPLVCRSYDCSKDKRIWENFDEYVPSADLAKLFPDAEPKQELVNIQVA